MGKLTINLVGGVSHTLPDATKELFDKFVEFFINEKKTNLTLETKNSYMLYLKDKILYISYTEDKKVE